MGRMEGPPVSQALLERGVRKGTGQQIQATPAMALSTMTCSAARNGHWPDCCPELIFRPNWGLALCIETTKADKKRSKAHFKFALQKELLGTQGQLQLSGAGSVPTSVCHPFTPAGLQAVPHSPQTHAQGTAGF